MPPLRLAALAPLALLAACNGSGEKVPERKTAAGEVLGGSISDSMLPLDTVQSQSPPLRESAGAKGGNETTDTADDSADGGDEAAPDASPSASPPAAASASATPQAEN